MVTWTRPDPQVGTKCFTIRRIGGASRAVTSEVTHIDPPRTWGVQGIDGPIRATVNVTVEPLTQTSSRLTIAELRRAWPRQTARPARRPPPGTKGNAGQRQSPEATRRGLAATAPGVEPGQESGLAIGNGRAPHSQPAKKLRGRSRDRLAKWTWRSACLQSPGRLSRSVRQLRSDGPTRPSQYGEFSRCSCRLSVSI